MATEKQRKLAKKIVDNRGKSKAKPIGKLMKQVGYSNAQAKNPHQIIKSKGFQELLDEMLPDEKLTEVHKKLLNAHDIGHMVFPLNMSDQEIKDLLSSVNCLAKKFMHSETQTHVWYWSPNTKAQKDAVELAYKIKNKFPAEKHQVATGGQDFIDQWKKDMGVDEQSLSTLQELVEDSPQDDSLSVPGDNSPNGS